MSCKNENVTNLQSLVIFKMSVLEHKETIFNKSGSKMKLWTWSFCFFRKLHLLSFLRKRFLRVNKNKWIARGKWSRSTYFCWIQRKINIYRDFQLYNTIPIRFSESIHINSQSLKVSCKMVVYHPVLAAVGHFPSCHSRSGHAYHSHSKLYSMECAHVGTFIGDTWPLL